MKRGCTQCGECLRVCPVFQHYSREQYAPKSKRLLLEPLHEEYGEGKDVASGLDWKNIQKLARLCVGCGRCQQVCARKLSTADLLSEVRAKHPNWSQHFWKLWIEHMGPTWPSLAMLASLVPENIAPKKLQPSLDSAKAMVNRTRNIEPWARIAPATPLSNAEAVMIFPGCTARNVRPQWEAKATKLLDRWGYDVVENRDFGCCGGTMHTAGLLGRMDAMQKVNVKAWRAAGKPRIAVFCASCHHSLKAYDESVLKPEEVEEWQNSLTPLSSLLVAPIWSLTREKPSRYGYHQPCHWGTDMDKPLLEKGMPGLIKGEALCCGMGGILQLTNADLSRSLADKCIDGFPENVDSIVTSCSGCTIQLTAAAPKGVHVYHWLDLVDC
ncbi:(Fe-S)-binding protein [Pseudodesulfovibrio sp.]|uniref:(Fe-S)-binding protein n=1 Tax=unclassified Pseudodesulfovibrio TaxID=2661612 RepID=UPI003AFFDFA5